MGKRGKHETPKPPASDQKSPNPVQTGNSFPVHEHVGRHLKALFDDVANEPIPDKLIDLLDELERRGTKPGEPR